MSQPTRRSVFATPLAVPREALAGWHHGPGAFARLVPHWKRVEILEPPKALAPGTRVVLRLREGPLALRWVAEIVQAGEDGFTDVQVSGPFGAWRHEHRFLAGDAGTSTLEDRIAWAPPGGAPGRLLLPGLVAADLARVFAFRHAVTREDLAREAELAASWAPAGRPRRGRVLVAGGTGLVGSRLVPLLRQLGFDVTLLTRRPRAEGELKWDPDAGTFPSARALAGFDAVVNLAGAGIADGRWTPARKALILRSRVEATSRLAELLGQAGGVPTYVTASGIAGTSTEGGPHAEGEGPAARGFLADVVRAWEGAAAPLRAAGTRVVALRLGAVLTPAGGALAKLLPPFLAGLGGPVGTGAQPFPWIAVDDAADLFVRAVADARLAGPVHAVAPGLVDQRAFASTLGRVLRRPAVVPLPSAAVRLLFGELGDEMLLQGPSARPAILTALGHRWRNPDLEGALRHVLGRERA